MATVWQIDVAPGHVPQGGQFGAFSVVTDIPDVGRLFVQCVESATYGKYVHGEENGKETR